MFKKNRKSEKINKIENGEKKKKILLVPLSGLKVAVVHLQIQSHERFIYPRFS